MLETRVSVERTLVLVKADGVQRRLVGEVISRFERSGLKVVGLKLLKPSAGLVSKNYPDSDDWYKKVGGRSLDTFKAAGEDPEKIFGTRDPVAIGKTVKSWIIRFMTSGRVVAVALEGNRAVDHVRRLVGETDPIKAAAGTIRGDLSIDDTMLGNLTHRLVVNLVHASGDVEEAKREVSNWFTDKELFEYKRDNEDVFYRVW